ncbi:hypothetical protein GDO78_000538 [Eleutherodactylus coqui]|uniref:Uncharacterized protein n=1 Tax=Eleutherodactylus coqui TaxID=57060 RepID=A0A8J6KFK4_ELECQ|nr:hypothetical protein GDO78_000538 [Eleutherodactylus coqui]
MFVNAIHIFNVCILKQNHVLLLSVLYPSIPTNVNRTCKTSTVFHFDLYLYLTRNTSEVCKKKNTNQMEGYQDKKVCIPYFNTPN